MKYLFILCICVHIAIPTDQPNIALSCLVNNDQEICNIQFPVIAVEQPTPRN